MLAQYFYTVVLILPYRWSDFVNIQQQQMGLKFLSDGNSSPTLSGGSGGGGDGDGGAVIAVFNPPRLEAPHKAHDGFSSGCRRVKVQSALIRASLVSSAHSGQHRALREHRKCVRPAGLPIPGPGSLLLHQRVLAEGGTDTMTVESIYESFLTLLMAGIKSGTVC